MQRGTIRSVIMGPSITFRHCMPNKVNVLGTRVTQCGCSEGNQTVASLCLLWLCAVLGAWVSRQLDTGILGSDNDGGKYCLL
jgi:hypothetical protein